MEETELLHHFLARNTKHKWITTPSVCASNNASSTTSGRNRRQVRHSQSRRTIRNGNNHNNNNHIFYENYDDDDIADAITWARTAFSDSPIQDNAMIQNSTVVPVNEDTRHHQPSYSNYPEFLFDDNYNQFGYDLRSHRHPIIVLDEAQEEQSSSAIVNLLDQSSDTSPNTSEELTVSTTTSSESIHDDEEEDPREMDDFIVPDDVID
jgi:hypothetical protein